MDEALLKRIAAILPSLGSASISEVTHAAQTIVRLLRENGHTLADLSLLLKQPRSPPPSATVVPFPKALPPERVPQGKWTLEPRGYDQSPANQRRVKSAWAIDRDDILSVFIRRGELDAWSHEFLESIHDQVQGGRTLSEKQRDKLNEILDKLGA